jgi:hypothetical protein
VTIENLLDDRAGATAANDMEDDVVVLKHPVPPIDYDTIDPYAGLIRINHPRLAQSGQNGGDLPVKTPFCPLEESVQATFTDDEPEQVAEQPHQALGADRVDKAQIQSSLSKLR